MRPYFDDGTFRIYHGNCFDVMPTIDRVDAVITDPPYEIEAHSMAQRQTRDHEIVSYQIPFAPITEVERLACGREFARLSRGWILVFCQFEAIDKWRQALEAGGAKWRRSQIWIKPDSAPNFSGDRPAIGGEAIATAWAGNGKSKWHGGGKRGVYEHCVNNFGRLTSGREHPTQKPELLICQLIQLFTNPGDQVIDPFMGVGTTLAAAKRIGRCAIGIEQDERYCEIAARRLSQGVLDLWEPASAEVAP